MKIIALKGLNGSGKSTVAALLSTKLTEKGISNKVLAFATPLKQITDKLFTEFKQGFDWEDRTTKDNNRNLLEDTANAIKDSFIHNPFVRDVLIQLDSLSAVETEVVIISDMRFEEEYNYIYDWLETDTLTVIEIINPLTTEGKYELDKIPTDIIVNFDNTLNEQLDKIIKEI